MAPDRYLGRHPRLASYFILGMALLVFALTIWLYTLSGRVSDGEAIRRAEAHAAVQRAAQEKRQRKLQVAQSCKLLRVFQDVSIDVPLANYKEILAGNTLTPAERRQRLNAQARYMAAQSFMVGLLKDCPK